MQKTKIKISVTSIIIAVLLVLYAVSLILLMGWGLINSFKSDDDYSFGGNILGFPDLNAWGAKEALAFGNYRKILFGSSFQFDAIDASYYSVLFGYVENAPGTTFTFGHFIF